MTELEEKEFNRKFDSWLDSEYDKYCEAEFDKYCQTLEQEKSKQLTQDDFKDAPLWINSMAVNSDGTAYGANRYSKGMYADEKLGIWKPKKSYPWTFCHWIGTGYDTTNWQQSAIDRE